MLHIVTFFLEESAFGKNLLIQNCSRNNCIDNILSYNNRVMDLGCVDYYTIIDREGVEYEVLLTAEK